MADHGDWLDLKAAHQEAGDAFARGDAAEMYSLATAVEQSAMSLSRLADRLRSAGNEVEK